MRTRSVDLFLSTAVPWPLGSTTTSLIQRSNMPRRPHTNPWIRLTSLVCFLFSIILQGALAFAVPMQNDPNGFEGIPWGATFSETDTFIKVEDTDRSPTY